MELVVAVTTQRVKDLASCALRMNTNNWWKAMHISQNESQGSLYSFNHGLLVDASCLETKQAKLCPARWEFHFSDLL